MPLAGPAIATVAILTFLPAWNSYLWPLMVVQTEALRPAMVGIDYFKQLQRLLGADHGLRQHDHRAGAGHVHRLPAGVHQLDRLVGSEGLMFALPESWVWDFWFADDGQKYHLFFLYASKALQGPRSPGTTGPRSGTRSSTDLTNWTRVDRRRSCTATPAAFDDLATWTGSVTRHPDGTWYLFYTGARLRRRPERADASATPPPPTCTTGPSRARPSRSADDRWYETLGGQGLARRGLPRPVGVRRPGRRRLAHAGHRPRAHRADRRPRRGRPLLVARPAHLGGASALVSSVGQGFGQLEVMHTVVVDGQPFLHLQLPRRRHVRRHAGHRHHRWYLGREGRDRAGPLRHGRRTAARRLRASTSAGWSSSATPASGGSSPSRTERRRQLRRHDHRPASGLASSTASSSSAEPETSPDRKGRFSFRVGRLGCPGRRRHRTKGHRTKGDVPCLGAS